VTSPCKSSQVHIDDMFDAKLPLDLATKAIKQLEDAAIPQSSHAPIRTNKSTPKLQRVYTAPSRPRTRPNTRAKRLVQAEEKDSSDIRIDSASLFKKLALIMPPLKTEYEYDDTRHIALMKAVSSCTEQRDAIGNERSVKKRKPLLRNTFRLKNSRDEQLECLIKLKKDSVLTLADWEELQLYQKSVLHPCYN
jgi:hypothetical protein